MPTRIARIAQIAELGKSATSDTDQKAFLLRLYWEAGLALNYAGLKPPPLTAPPPAAPGVE